MLCRETCHPPKGQFFEVNLLEIVVVLRLGDAWLVGVGKRAPHGFPCPFWVSPHGSLDRLKAYTLFPLH